MSIVNIDRYEKMWGDECYYNIEGECEFFQDWIMQTKDEVFLKFLFIAFRCTLIITAIPLSMLHLR